MSFFNFYKKWFLLVFLGWFKIIKIIYKILIQILLSLPVSLWMLYLVSISMLILVFFPWFSYEIRLDNLSTEMIRSKKWYFFIIPAFFSFIFSLLIYKSYYYILHLVINIFILIIYIYGFFHPEFHILVKENYDINFVFYLYFFVIVLHTILVTELRKPNRYVSYYISELWNEKRKKYL